VDDRIAVTQSNAPITRPRAPGWLGCELCERPASRPHRRLRLTLVRHNDDDHGDSDDSVRETDRQTSRVPPHDAATQVMLILLCSDCCALIVGTIDDDEWRRRTIGTPAPDEVPMLPPPSQGSLSSPAPAAGKAPPA